MIRRTATLPAILLLLSLGTLSAQNVGKVSGTVRDAATGEPLIGCNVSLVGTTLGASTDPDGAFFILNVPPGMYDIQASLLGYQRVLQRNAIVNSGKTTTANFTLASTLVAQQEVVVQAVRPDVEREIDARRNGQCERRPALQSPAFVEQNADRCSVG